MYHNKWGFYGFENVGMHPVYDVCISMKKGHLKVGDT